MGGSRNQSRGVYRIHFLKATPICLKTTPLITHLMGDFTADLSYTTKH